MNESVLVLVVFVSLIIVRLLKVYFNLKFPKYDEIFEELEDDLDESIETVSKIKKISDKIKKGGK